MPYITPETAITGNFITAADGNRRRDNDEYFKGRSGPISIENSVAVSGNLGASGTTSAGAFATSGPAGQYQFNDRVDGTPWVWYAAGGAASLYNGALGNLLSFVYNTGQMNWTDVNDPDNGIPPRRLRRVTRLGMLGSAGGTQQIAYNGDGTVAWIHFPDGISAVSTVTFEYSGGLVTAVRLRLGGADGPIINSVGFQYDGAGRVVAIGQS